MYKLIIIIFFLPSFYAFSQQQTIAPSDTIKSKGLQDVEVTGRVKLTSKTTISTEASASPASVTLVGKDYIAKQSYLSYGDLLRPLAGVNVANFQQGGVGYGIEMRGYTTTEHARDIAFFIDGIPQNQGSSIEANGYTDLNPIIPENIKRVEVIRGPFSPFYGDHALGGAISFETEDRLPSTITLSAGTFGTVRGLATYGFGKNKSSGYVSVEGSNTDAYRDNNAEKHLNGVAKYVFPLWNGMASVRAQAYGSDFGSAGYLTRSDIDAGMVSPKSAIGSTDGGTTRQQNLVFNYKGADSLRFTSATIYVQHNDFVRIRTRVVNGPQGEERDNRTWYGADLRRTRITTLGKMPVLFAAGINFRADVISNTAFTTMKRQIVSQHEDKQVNTFTPAAYAQMQLQPSQRLKITLSARYDYLLYNIKTGAQDSDTANLSSAPNTGVFSPKAGLAYLVANGVNLFFNAAQGFSAPSGYDELIHNADLSPAKLISYEIGIAGDNANGQLHGLVSAYTSKQTKEIQADAFGDLTNFGSTRRNGIEAEGRARLTQKGGLTIFGNYTRVSAKILNGGPDEIYVTSTPVYFGTVGFDYDFGAATQANNRFVLSIYDQLIGNKNLNTSGTIRSASYQRLSGKISYRRGNWANFRIFAEGSYYPGSGYLDEMDFLSGGKVLTSPQARGNFRAGIKIPF